MSDTSIPRKASRRLLPVVLALSRLPQIALANANAPCYDPSGTVAPGFYPCDSTAYITNCCADGWTCFSNSLCVVTTESTSYPNLTMGAVSRAMCTNPEWNNQICGDFCITGSGNDDGEMVACGNDRFCCLGDYNAGLCNCTASDGDSFVVNGGKAQTIIGETASFTGTVSYLTSLPTPSPTTAASSTPGTATATASTASTATGTSGTPTPTPAPKKSSHALAIGVGVGVGAGLLVLPVLAFVIYRLWQRRSAAGRGYGRRSLPTDLALDGTEFGEQMAMQANDYQHGAGGAGGSGGGGAHGASGHLLDFNDIGEVPPPPHHLRHDAN